MSRAIPIIIGCLVLTTVAAVATSAHFFVMKESAIKQQLIAEKERAESDMLREEIHDRLTAVITAKEDMKQEVSDLKAKALKLAQQLDQDRMGRQSLEEKAFSADARLEELESALHDAQEKQVQQVAMINSLQEQLREVGSERDAARQRQGELEQQLKDAISAVPASTPQVVVKQISPPVHGAKGAVMMINRDAGYIIISVGTQDKAANGAFCLVYRNEKMLGRIQIEEADPTMSTARAVSPGLLDVIKEGDVVQLL